MGDLDRYHRQILLPGFGEAGQRRLLQSSALIVGCGALGSAIADALARAGVGSLSLIDRDTVELTNLQRQLLYDESDVAAGIPKAEAARARLARINSAVNVQAFVDDFNHRNAERYLAGCDVLLDGLDNFETRYLLNDLAVRHGLPWVYGGAVATGGMSMVILPHPRHRAPAAGGIGSSVRWAEEQSTPCLRCVFPDPPPPGAAATCDTAGVLGPAVTTIAAHQAAEALKLLTGNLDALDRSLLSVDLWRNAIRRFDVGNAARAGSCPCCGAGRFDYLTGGTGAAATTLCGRNAVQITPPGAPGTGQGLDLPRLAERLSAHGTFTHNGFLLHGRLAPREPAGSGVELTVFPDGRAIIKGVSEPEAARSLYARYVGN